GLDHLEALELEVGRQGHAQRGLVIHHQHLGHVHLESYATLIAGAAAGSSMVNVEPWPGSLFTSILPSCLWTRLATMANPSPVPLVLVVKRGSKIFAT